MDPLGTVGFHVSNNVRVKLAWINSLYPHRRIRADGESVSILSSKDGHLQKTRTHTMSILWYGDKKSLSPLLPEKRKVARKQNDQLPSSLRDNWIYDLYSASTSC